MRKRGDSWRRGRRQEGTRDKETWSARSSFPVSNDVTALRAGVKQLTTVRAADAPRRGGQARSGREAQGQSGGDRMREEEQLRV